MSNEDPQKVGLLKVVHVPASPKNPLAKLVFAFMTDKPAIETLIQMVNPVAQHSTFYVQPAEKARFIAETRAALDAWEKAPT